MRHRREKRGKTAVPVERNDMVVVCQFSIIFSQSCLKSHLLNTIYGISVTEGTRAPSDVEVKASCRDTFQGKLSIPTHCNTDE